MDDFVSSTVVPTKIDVRDLQIGMYVCQLDKPWLDSPFLFQGFELKTQADIDAVRKECQFVYIDVQKQESHSHYQFKNSPSPHHHSTQTPNKKTTVSPRLSFIQEIDHASSVHQQGSSLVRSFMEDVQLGRAINTAIAQKAVAQCVDSILQCPDALLLMSQLKSKDEYTAQHSMNVCILSIALGKQLGFSPQELNHVGLCGMLHDMGKMKIPSDILNKPGPLNNQEFHIMQTHAEEGGKILMTSKDIYAGAVDAAMKHHERLNGSGYPKHLFAEQIPLYCRIVAVADVYDAISSDRVYQTGKTHLETINIMTKMSGTDLDNTLTLKFIEALGIYPAGSLVELKTGEVAIVMETNPKNKLKPKILLLLNEQKQPRSIKLVDLAMTEKLHTKDRTITQIIRPEKYGINLMQYDFPNITNGLITKI